MSKTKFKIDRTTSDMTTITEGDYSVRLWRQRGKPTIDIKAFRDDRQFFGVTSEATFSKPALEAVVLELQAWMREL